MRKDDLIKKTPVRPRARQGKATSVATKKITMKKETAREQDQSTLRHRRMVLAVEIIAALMVAAAIVWIIILLVQVRTAKQQLQVFEESIIEGGTLTADMVESILTEIEEGGGEPLSEEYADETLTYISEQSDSELTEEKAEETFTILEEQE